ncbi:FecR domain-containing protein [uncultured Roseivirga sp.]|uniref:FecR domain-containing protein n=1 Tax=uncultured Roseivirga sp. TaxID=543088 RepID=UPI0030DDD64B|tara:strand:+ start:4832 stop:5815 length:984 start_codon:yes stop_codon:yes gene_type:complete
MKNRSTIDEHLLLPYLKGEATEAELQQVEAWLALDKGNAALLDKWKQAWKHADAMADFAAIDVDKNWLQVQSKIQPKKAKQVFLLPKIWRVAAAILLIATVAFLGREFMNSSAGEMQTLMAASLNGEAAVLPDGSQVWLKEGSSITFPEEFSSAEREVTLKGEGFFEVAHNPEQPFIVKAKQTETRVLGTSFNLNASQEGERIELVLMTGKVRFSTQEEVVVLAPGDQVVIDEGGKLSKKENSNGNFLAWKTGTLVFENTPMKQVMEDIANAYGIGYEFENIAFMNCPLTTRFENESIENVLQAIEALFDIEIEENNGTYIIKGNGC